MSCVPGYRSNRLDTYTTVSGASGENKEEEGGSDAPPAALLAVSAYWRAQLLAIAIRRLGAMGTNSAWYGESGLGPPAFTTCSELRESHSGAAPGEVR